MGYQHSIGQSPVYKLIYVPIGLFHCFLFCLVVMMGNDTLKVHIAP